MKVLIACEESQSTCIEFRNLGIEAYSCDIQDCSGGHPEWHIKDDVLKIINDNWNLIIAHPPCQYLSNAAASYLFKGKKLNKERFKKGMLAKDFFMEFYNNKCKYICIENPIPSSIYNLPKPSQSIQPYFFGDPYKKFTYLWLKNLPKLIHNNKINLFDKKITHVKPISLWVNRSYTDKFDGLHKDKKMRSKTFKGISKAMAEQWTKYLLNEKAGSY